MSKLETTIAQLAKQHAALTDRRSKAQAALDKAVAARQQALLGADEIDEKTLARVQSAICDAASLLQGIDDAMTVVAQQQAEAEATLAEENAVAGRKTASERLAAQVAGIEASLPGFVDAARAHVDRLMQVHWHPESAQVATYLIGVIDQVELATNVSAAELRGMVSAVADGRMPIPAPKPEPVPVPAPKPAPETRRLFALRAIRWTDAEGRVRHCQQYEDCDLTPLAAQRGLRVGAVCALDDPRRKTLKGARGGQHVNVNAIDLLDLDAISDASGARFVRPENDPVLAAANIREFDRGIPERKIAIEVART
jgi:hypothetical protein